MSGPRPPWLPVTATATPANDIPADTRDLVLARAGGRCESCGERLALHDYALHHRRVKGMGGSRAAIVHSPSNLLAVCGRDRRSGCHGLIHNNPTAAYDAGLLVHQGATPARVAVQLHDGRRVLLTPNGSYAPEETS